MRQKLGAVFVLAALGLAVSACSDTDPPERAASDGPTRVPTTAAPTSSVSPTTGPLASRTLAASDLPAALSGNRRRLPATTVVGACNRVPLLTIGAVRTATVSFTGKGHTVTSEVARVADEKSAALMLKSLRALHDRCSAHTTPITSVAAPGATAGAWRYVATTSRGAEGFGVAVAGRTMTVVAIDADAGAVEAHLDQLLATAAQRIG